jgi:hypothetical protein
LPSVQGSAWNAEDAAAQKHRLQPIQVLLVRRHHDGCHGGGHAGVVEGLVPVETRLPVGLGQGDGQREVRRGDVPDDDALWRRFKKGAVVGVMGAIRPVHDKLPPALRLELKDLEGIAEAVRPPPSCETVGIGKRREDLRGREGEEAAGFENTVCAGLGGHGLPWWMWCEAGFW